MKRFFAVAAFCIAPGIASHAALAQPTTKPQTVKVFLVALGDNGKIGRRFGCEDSLVPVTRTIAPTRAPLRAALHELLTIPPTYGPNPKLSNYWKGRNLQIHALSIRNGTATIRLSGQIFVAGVCDEPRIEEQIKATVLQFASVKKVRIFIGNRSLSEAIS
jgi:hypothetical protein